MPLFFIFIRLINPSLPLKMVDGLIYQTDAHLAGPFKLCSNVSQPEGHIPLLASTEQIEL